MIDRSGSQIDHLNIAVPDLAAATAFYEPVLATLGIVRILTIPAFPGQHAMVGFGWADVKPFFWLLEKGVVGTGMHLAFSAAHRAEADAFTVPPSPPAPPRNCRRRSTRSTTRTTTAASSPIRWGSAWRPPATRRPADAQRR